jgi:hypothetical protein
MLHIPTTPATAGNGCRIGRVRPAPARATALAPRPARGEGTGIGRDRGVAGADSPPRRGAAGPAVLAQALALLRDLARRLR